jgi:glutamine amidotransferase
VITVGVVDYGVGNHASVENAIRHLGYRAKVSADQSLLKTTDILLLPGVGAFPEAMRSLHERGLTPYIQEHVASGRPLLGICLGMQLMATASHERGYTEGLNLIPGEVYPLEDGQWHIGWNDLQCIVSDALVCGSHGHHFYFNHSYAYRGAGNYELAVSQASETITALIRRENVIGMQFHPEKSQEAGYALLQALLRGLASA